MSAGATLTLEKLRAMRLMLLERPILRDPSEGIERVIVTTEAKVPDGRLFPASRHRSRRIRKKLIRRFGGEYRYKPAILKVGSFLLVHPALEREIAVRLPEARPSLSLFPPIGFGLPIFRWDLPA